MRMPPSPGPDAPDGSPPPDDSPAGRHFRVYNARSIGAAIRGLRAARGLTQRQLADELGIPLRYISTLEQGHATEQLERLLTVLAALDARLVVQEGAPW